MAPNGCLKPNFGLISVIWYNQSAAKDLTAFYGMGMANWDRQVSNDYMVCLSLVLCGGHNWYLPYWFYD